MKLTTKLLALVMISLLAPSTFAASPACGYVKEPLSPAQAATQLGSVKGMFLEEGASRDTLPDGRTVYQRLGFRIDETGVTVGYGVYSELWLPMETFRETDKYSVDTDRFSAPLEMIRGGILVEKVLSATPGDILCRTFSILVKQDAIFISSVHSTNHQPADLTGLMGGRRIARMK